MNKLNRILIVVLVSLCVVIAILVRSQHYELINLLNEVKLINKIDFDESIPKEFLMALAKVESNYNPNAVGDDGKAVGILQIHKVYVDDVNKISGFGFTYEDRKDPEKSIKMARIYLRHYGARYERITGNKYTYEVLARIHNGGPNGFRKDATVKYWKKVQEVLNENQNF